ncbi:hypothetical protein EAX61_10645 [Dokdonia sinensis]|uniref:Uncharacterized protein n=1 Tax=Dokdonia sinensis TaxID=2479847 RepID=A0A3M0G5N5_9FLAO|nr:hypothetical protein [Dokdonia sinensis]RMB57572.1 hypothetical protein EAX61_10645 [Dokdonia sinensis]
MFHKVKVILIVVCGLLAVATLIDFDFDSGTFTEQIEGSDQKRQRYYNAGGNSHKTFKVYTNSFSIPVTKVFYKTIQEGDQVVVSKSLLFEEINKVENVRTTVSETHSMRYFSGLAIPILMLIVAGLAFKFKNKYETLIFVVCVLTIANFIYILN